MAAERESLEAIDTRLDELGVTLERVRRLRARYAGWQLPLADVDEELAQLTQGPPRRAQPAPAPVPNGGDSAPPAGAVGNDPPRPTSAEPAEPVDGLEVDIDVEPSAAGAPSEASPQAVSPPQTDHPATTPVPGSSPPAPQPRTKASGTEGWPPGSARPAVPVRSSPPPPPPAGRAVSSWPPGRPSSSRPPARSAASSSSPPAPVWPGGGAPATTASAAPTAPAEDADSTASERRSSAEIAALLEEDLDPKDFDQTEARSDTQAVAEASDDMGELDLDDIEEIEEIDLDEDVIVEEDL